MLKFVEDSLPNARIKVIGIGGGGGNAVNRMITAGLKGVEFVAVNTDAQALKNSLASHKLQIGMNLTRGLGVGGNPELGRKAAEESREELKEILDEVDMVFLTAGFGGGTGTGATPLIAEIAKEKGILTVGVVTKPFMFEGKIRAFQAEEGLKRIKDNVDTLLVIPNQKIFSIITQDTLALDAFKIVDDVLRQAIQSISDIITSHGMINVDFADVKTIMKSAGRALMGIGEASGENRAEIAAKNAIVSPLLEDVSIQGAKGLLVNITGNKDLKMQEIKLAMEIISAAISPDANVFFGQAFNEAVEDKIKLTVIATGFGEEEKKFSSFSIEEDKKIHHKKESQQSLEIPTFLRKKKNE